MAIQVMDQMTLPTTEPPVLPPRKRTKPILKWAGGKRWLVPLIAPAIHARLQTTGGRYVEPFLGGGAIALDLGLPKMIVGDVCADLINFYLTVRQYPKQVSWALDTMIKKGIDEATYYQVRDAPQRSPIFAAARFLYLNKLCHGGLYRVNKQGQYNVPYGKYESPAIPIEEAFHAVASAFSDAGIAVRGFEETLSLVRAGDVVYCDPPYYKTFTGYSAVGFTDQDQQDLATMLKECVDKGAQIIASNSDHPRVRELYEWAFVTPIAERHAINRNGADRDGKAAVLILSDQHLLAGFAS
jgi:DNA adenine methylase